MDALGATALEVMQHLGLGRLFPTMLADPERGLAPELAALLGWHHIELCAAWPVDRAPGEQRAFLSLRRHGRTIAYAKVERAGGGNLAREASVLEHLQAIPLRSIVTPRVLGRLDWEGFEVLVLEPVPIATRTDRPAGTAELAALTELASLGPALEPVVGSRSGQIPVHGDFCGWNSAPAAPERLALWDWEDTRLGLPLEDLFHWRMQRLVHFGHGSVQGLVASALRPDGQIELHCRGLGVGPDVAAPALEACLLRGLRSGKHDERAVRIRRQALDLLRGAA